MGISFLCVSVTVQIGVRNLASYFYSTIGLLTEQLKKGKKKTLKHRGGGTSRRSGLGGWCCRRCRRPRGVKVSLSVAVAAGLPETVGTRHSCRGWLPAGGSRRSTHWVPQVHPLQKSSVCQLVEQERLQSSVPSVPHSEKPNVKLRGKSVVTSTVLRFSHSASALTVYTYLNFTVSQKQPRVCPRCSES